MVWIEKSVTRDHSASPVMPISDPRDGFFYPHHTSMKDTYSIILAKYCDQKYCSVHLPFLRMLYFKTELNDLRKIIRLRKSEVFVEKNSVCNVTENLAEHGIYCLPFSSISDVINMLAYNYAVILISK